MGFLKLFGWLSVVIHNVQSISIETVLKEYSGAGFVEKKNGAMSLLYVAKDKKVQKCIIILF
jgi:hypothetical protein